MKTKILYIFLLISLTGFAQSTVNGVVTDDSGTPMLGVNVIIKNTTTGTMTDFDGKYSIEAKSDDVLSFSAMGMVTKNVLVGSNKQLNVVMKADVAQLDEVVVIGYGSVAKKDLTGSVATIKTEVLETAPVANFDEALTGRLAGVSVSGNEGTPGEALKIVVRGGNSITSTNNPLYVINGLPLEDFDPSSINTSDIESYQVLKDASATAIYGSRGANGVIVITTKSGKSNSKTEVSFNISRSIQEITKTLEVLNGYQYVKYLQTQSIARDGYVVDPNGDNLSSFIAKWVDPELYRSLKGRDYQDEVFNIAPMTQASFSIRGGNDKTSISFSSGFTDQEGVLITTGFKKWTTNFTIKHKLSDKFSLWGAMNYSNANRYGAEMRTGNANQQLRNIILSRPVEPLNPDDGEEEGGFNAGADDAGDYTNLFDPVKDMNNTFREDKSHNIRVNTSLTYRITDDFTFKTTNGFNTTIGKEGLFYSKDTQQGTRSTNGINGQIETYERSTYSTSNTLQFNKDVKSNNFKALIGIEHVHYTNFTSKLWNKNLETDEFGLSNLDVGLNTTLSETDESENTLLSYFGRVNLNLKGKYLLTATYRADGSSKFQGDNRWGYFPSFSGAWQIGKEKFMDNVNFVNSLKLRAGWGLTGNNRVGDFISLDQLGFNKWNQYLFGVDEDVTLGVVQTVFAMPDLKWEKTGQTNIGMDFSMFQSRFSGTLDYYYKKTEDLLLYADMALSTGFAVVVQNVGSVSNQGFELSLRGLIFDNKDFRWETNFNISTNKNKVLSLNYGQEFIKNGVRIDWYDEDFYISEVGEPVGMMYGFEYDGLYQADDFTYDTTNSEHPYTLKDGVPSQASNVGPGFAKFVDQDGNGVIDQDDRVVIGDPHAKHFGGLSNNFKYKNIDLSIFLQWSYDFDIYNANRALWSYPSQKSYQNRLSDVANAWTPWNTDTDVITPYSNGYASWPREGYRLDSRFIEDGSYVRLKTVTLGYNLPLKEDSLFKNIRFAVSGQNLYTWTSYSGFDPEVSTQGNSVTPNLDWSAYPKSRTYNFSISAKF